MKIRLEFSFRDLSQKVITKSLTFFKKEHRKGRNNKSQRCNPRGGGNLPKCGIMGHGRKQLQKRRDMLQRCRKIKSLMGSPGLGTGR